jgi:phosphoglycerol transferase MdoB-like AlkP superfamily enzyme
VKGARSVPFGICSVPFDRFGAVRKKFPFFDSGELRYFWAILSLLFAHRLFLSNDLGIWRLPDVVSVARAISAGLLSDFWAASLLFVLSTWESRLQRVVFCILAVSLCFHIPYVSFFKVTFRAIHVSYLWDTSFWLGSWSEVFRYNVLTQLVVFGALAVGFLSRITTKPGIPGIPGSPMKPKVKNQVPLVVFILGVGVVCNALSNRLQRKWSLSPQIVLNTFVGFGLDVFESRAEAQQQEVALAELSNLQKRFGSYKSYLQQMSAVAVQNQATESSVSQLSEAEAALGSLRLALQNEFAPEIVRAKPRYFVVFLLESARALESELMGGAPYSPSLDARLRKGGVAFTKGFSTGLVSRAGAESTMCNSFASTLHNALRDNPAAEPVCGPELVGMLRPDLPHQGWWIHGGYPTFDGQLEFWTRQKFKVPVNVLNPKADCEYSGYGVTDRCFFELVSAFLKRDSAQFTAPGLHLIQIANLSNHTPFELPNDASKVLTSEQVSLVQNMISNSSVHHGLTSLYADAALDQFLEEIKDQPLWKDGVWLFVGDHGMKQDTLFAPPSADSTPLASDFEKGVASTHVYFGLGGGLVEKHLQDGLVAPWPVSQIDVLPTLADMLNSAASFPFLGSSFFQSHRTTPWPVMSDLVNSVQVVPSRKTREEQVNFNSKETMWSKADFYQSRDPRLLETRLNYLWYLKSSQSGEFSRQTRAAFSTLPKD